jgi:hypothetical protein
MPAGKEMSIARDLCRTTLLCAILASSAIARAASFERYPGAQIDEHTTDAANYRLARVESGRRTHKTTIYATTDPFDKVLAFYRKRGRMFTLPGGLGKPSDLPEGKQLRQAYVILDGASGLKASKRWVKIQSPYVGPVWKNVLKKGDKPVKELTAILYVDE